VQFDTETLIGCQCRLAETVTEKPISVTRIRTKRLPAVAEQPEKNEIEDSENDTLQTSRRKIRTTSLLAFPGSNGSIIIIILIIIVFFVKNCQKQLTDYMKRCIK